MKYEEEMQRLTNESIPKAWENVVKVEQMAEILVYNMLVECMNNFEEVSVEISNEDPVAKVLRSWVANEDNDFGKNAIYLKEGKENTTILGCVYDLYKIRDDIEMIEYDLFGTIADDDIIDIATANSEIPDEEINAYTDAITIDNTTKSQKLAMIKQIIGSDSEEDK